MLIDSNIIIYAATPEFANLRQFIAENTPVVSAVSYVEVLGFHRLLRRRKYCWKLSSQRQLSSH